MQMFLMLSFTLLCRLCSKFKGLKCNILREFMAISDCSSILKCHALEK